MINNSLNASRLAPICSGVITADRGCSYHGGGSRERGGGEDGGAGEMEERKRRGGDEGEEDKVVVQGEVENAERKGRRMRQPCLVSISLSLSSVSQSSVA